MTKHGFTSGRHLTRFALPFALFLVACGGASDTNDAAETQFVVAGYLENVTITEASGLARSSRDDRFWVINDGGSLPQLHAIGHDGRDYGSVMLEDAQNIDWEDLATYEDGEQLWLIVADVGDNLAKRNEYALYIVVEPGADELRTGTTVVQRRISFTYPDGPRDAESIVVDADNEKILILTKRDMPAVLYSVPLYPTSNQLLTATRIGEIGSIPQPTDYDLERALPDNNWHWQPGAIDFSAAGDAAVLLTYKAVYLFYKNAEQSWFEALQNAPQQFDLGDYREAESVAFDNTGEHIYVTTEKRNAPLLRLKLEQKTISGDTGE